MIERLCVIGVGLIGGSIASGLRTRKAVKSIVGVDNNHDNLIGALQRGVIDSGTSNVAEGVSGADTVVIAVPVGSIENIFCALKPHWSKSTLYTDTGSTKCSVVASARSVFGTLPQNFVPGHPIAGAEQSGVEASNPDLYVKKRVVITPVEETAPHMIEQAEELWKALEADVFRMSPQQHDEILAATSHLPHILAFVLTNMLGQKEDHTDIFRFAAGGFRDFTRIASSDPTMWRDISLANRHQLVPLIRHYCSALIQTAQWIEEGQTESLYRLFSHARKTRQHYLAQLEKRMTHTHSITFCAQPAHTLRGEVRVPGDKSISHRSMMLGSIAQGITKVTGFLQAEDCLATLNAFRAMGVLIEGPHNGEVILHGVGLHGLQAPSEPLYLGNSGTSMRLLSGLLAGQSFDTVLTGDPSLSRRPMKRVTDPLRSMGAVIKTSPTGTAPLEITGGKQLVGQHYTLPVASAQVKSCLLLAGLYAEGRTSVTEPAPTRDHTERMLAGLGYPIQREGATVSITRGGTLTACDIDVPGDISSAAFFMVGASIAENAEVLLKHVGINPTRTGIIAILQQMGGDITLLHPREIGGEPVADILVRSSRLHGIAIPDEMVPLAIDEFPVLFIAAACAEGETRLTGAEELRVKESDRIQVMADGLRVLGIDAQPTPDGMVIRGGRMSGGRVHSHGDHRIAMAFSIAALTASGSIEIEDCANVNTSFPNFVSLSDQLGLTITVHEDNAL